MFFALISALEGVAPYSWAQEASAGGAVGPVAMAAWISIVVVLVMSSVGMYNREVMCRMEAVISRAAITFPLAFAALYSTILSFSAVVGGDFELRTIISVGVPACVLVTLLVHGLFVGILNSDRFKRRLLVVGSGRMAAKVAQMAGLGHKQFSVVGYVDCGADDEGSAQALAPLFPLSNIAKPEDAIAFVKLNEVDEILVASRERRGLPFQSLLECRMQGVLVQDFATFCESEAGYVELDELQPSYLIFSDGFRMNRGRLFTKACVDYLVAALLLILTLPITVPTALAIKLTSPGPVFFRQERVGRNGKVFNVLKFRSMRSDAEKGGPQWAKANDDRVTSIGRFIRKVRIDEIPQVINVLLGEMSFIGPRPERPFFVKSLSEVIPYFNERHRVNPRITGWAQINYPYGASVEDAKNKLAYDLYYLKNGGIFLDMVILLQTVRVILWNSGAR